MVWVWLLPWLQFVPAFVSLDLSFRLMDVTPAGLDRRLRRYALVYAAVAIIFAGGAAWLQWRIAGLPGVGIGLANVVPWWLLWRFGLRKQLTYLFKDDGGRAIHMEKPDP